MHGIYYKIEDGRIWSVDEARYLEEEESPSPAGRLIDLLSADGDGSEEYLTKTLIFYGFGLGAYEEEYGVRTALEIHKTDPAAHGINTHLADPAAHGLDNYLMDFARHKADLAAHGNRIRLTNHLHLYVDQNSNQAGNSPIDGRGTEEFPFLDVQAAIDYVQDNYDLGSYNAYINVAPGTYEENLDIRNLRCKIGCLYIRTKANNSSNAIIKGAIWAGYYSGVYIQNLDIENSNSNFISSNLWYALYCSYRSNLNVDNVTVRMTDSNNKRLVSVCAEIFSYLHIRGGGLVIENSSESLLLANVLSAYHYSQIYLAGGITIKNDISCTGEFANADYMSFIRRYYTANITMNGTFTGKRYSVNRGSQIYTGGGPEFFPGTVAGTADMGGQYF